MHAPSLIEEAIKSGKAEKRQLTVRSGAQQVGCMEIIVAKQLSNDPEGVFNAPDE